MIKSLNTEYEITDEGNVPAGLQAARTAGMQIQCLTSIGWVDVDVNDGFRFGVTYRGKAVSPERCQCKDKPND